MIKVIVHVAKIIVAAIAALVMVSCSFGAGLDGNGNVVTKNRSTQNFNAVAASGGLEVVVKQGDKRVITVEADENLHRHIKTGVKRGVLEIGSDMNIRNAQKIKITVMLPDIAGLEATGGAALTTKGAVRANKIELKTAGGGSMRATLYANTVKCEAGGGSQIDVKGKAGSMDSSVSGGSTINAKNLVVETAGAEASSGGETFLNVTNELTAGASSGGSVYYLRTPKNLHKKTSSGGNVLQD